MTEPPLPARGIYEFECNYNEPIDREIVQIINFHSLASVLRPTRASYLVKLIEAAQLLVSHATTELEREVDRMKEIDRE